MTSHKIRFAVCGFGHIGKKHAELLLNHPDCSLVAIIDINSQVKEHEVYPGEIPFFSSLESYIAEDGIAEVMVLATPNGFHISQAELCIHSGMHVIIEKPMGLSKDSCEALISLARTLQKHVFVVKQNRFSPTVKWLKDLSDQKRLGKIFWVNIQCYWNRDERYYGNLINETNPDSKADLITQMKIRQLSGLHPWKGSSSLDGGVLFTQFSHFIDIMFWVFGDIKNIKSRMYNFNHSINTHFEDSGIITFDFMKEGSGSLQFTTSVWDKNMESSIVVIGENGSIKIGGQYMNKVEYCHVHQYDLPQLEPTNAPNNYGNFSGSAANHAYIIDNAVKTISGMELASIGPEDGMKVVDIIERMYKAVKE